MAEIVGFFTLILLNDIFTAQIDGLENISIFLLLLIFIVYSIIFLRGKIWEKILVSVIPTVTALPINLTVMAVFSAVADNNREAVLSGGILRIPALFFSKVIFFFACEIVIRVRKKQSSSLTGFQWIIQISCFVISFLISSLLWNIFREQNETSPYLLLIFLLIATLNILLYVLMTKMQRDNVTNEEYALVKSNLEAQQKFAVETKERYSEMRTLRHDVKHYLSTAAELIAEGNVEKAGEYIESVIEKKISPTVIGVDTGSAVIDAVINDSLSRCAEEGITTKRLIDTQFISKYDVDVSILLSNLLDNAISGCKGIDCPVIEITITNKKSLTQIVVSNSILKSVLNNNPNLETSQIDKSLHGFGIKSIKRIVQSYNGKINFLENKGKFEAEIWLNLEK